MLTFGEGEILGSLGVTEEFLTEAPAEPAGMIPDEYKAKFAKEADRLVFKASFEKGTLVMLNLEGENGTPGPPLFRTHHQAAVPRHVCRHLPGARRAGG